MTTLQEELLKEGVDGHQVRNHIQTGFNNIVNAETDYLIKIESFAKKILKENQDLKAELQKLKEDKAENEAMHQRVIDSYKAKLNALYGKKQFSDFENETYNSIIDNLK